MIRKAWLLFTLLATVARLTAQVPGDFTLREPVSVDSLKTVAVWATQYYIPRFFSQGTIPIMDERGNPTGFFADTCHFCEARLEGTAYITDSSGKVLVINYAKDADTSFTDCRQCARYSKSKLNVQTWGRSLWTISSGYGLGVKNYKLVPYRTIAVDPAFIPYGTAIYIPSVKGRTIVLPDGTIATHDGYFFAGDTGSAIKGNHIDVFTGINTENPFPDLITSQAGKAVNVHIVDDESVKNALRLIHLP